MMRRPRASLSFTGMALLAVTAVALIVSSQGSVSFHQSITNIAGRSESARCADSPAERHSADEHSDEMGGHRFQYVSHRLTGSDLETASARLATVRFPRELPSWVTCEGAEAEWIVQNEEQTGGTLRVEFFDAPARAASTKRLFFQFSHPGLTPPFPAFTGQWEPIEGRTDWYQDVSQPADTFTRIGWSANGDYFELSGPVTLDEALRLADSVS